MKLYDAENGREQWYEPFTPSFVEEMFASPEPDPICKHEDLHDALKQLTARQRFVIELRYGLRDGEAWTQDEIADLAGWSKTTVQEHEHRAEQKLYRVLTGEIRRRTPCQNAS